MDFRNDKQRHRCGAPLMATSLGDVGGKCAECGARYHVAPLGQSHAGAAGCSLRAKCSLGRCAATVFARAPCVPLARIRGTLRRYRGSVKLTHPGSWTRCCVSSYTRTVQFARRLVLYGSGASPTARAAGQSGRAERQRRHKLQARHRCRCAARAICTAYALCIFG